MPQQHAHKSQEKILEEIKDKSRLIHIQQTKANKGEFKDYGGALGIQRLHNQRKSLKAALAPFKVVSEGISCRDCIYFIPVGEKVPNSKISKESFCGYAEVVGKGITPTDIARRDITICGQEAKAFKHD